MASISCNDLNFYVHPHHEYLSDDFWDTKDARVICKMLGYDPTNSVATRYSAYGLVTDHFIMDDVQCNGNETSIWLCTRKLGENCGRTEGAGVICESPRGILNESTQSTQI